MDKTKFPELAKKFYEKEGKGHAHYMILRELIQVIISLNY